MQQPVDREGFLRAGVGKQGYNHPAKVFLPALRAEFLALSPVRRKAAAAGWNLPRWLMAMTVVSVVFGVFAVGLIVLLIYKSTLTMHEDDQLFLDDANSHMQEEQTELLTKVNRLTLPVRVFSVGSGVFLLVLVAMLIYQKLNEVQ
jgi:multisubunit Na+/H+ antiporter MnhB subunit